MRWPWAPCRPSERARETRSRSVGFDATEDRLSAIQDGTMNATVAQQPSEIGSLGVENAIRVIDGESVEENIPVAVQLVTPDNVSEFL
jgi:ribose transport system substrate-binding protein